MTWAWEALTLQMFWGMTCRLSPDHASALGGRLLEMLAPCLRKTGHIERNLAVAFPDLEKSAIRDLACKVWRNFGRVLAEYPHLGTIAFTDETPRMEVVVDAGIAADRWLTEPKIFVAAHLANWELTAPAAIILGFPLTVVYTRQKNPLIDRMVQRRRAALNCGFVAKDEGLRPIVRDLSKGRSIGILADQRLDGSPTVPFFGRDTLTAVSPARLALKFGYDLVPVRMERLEGARFRTTFCRPIVPEPGIDDDTRRAVDMTAKVNAVFESWIQERPGEWLCAKRRWPKPVSAIAPQPPCGIAASPDSVRASIGSRLGPSNGA